MAFFLHAGLDDVWRASVGQRTRRRGLDTSQSLQLIEPATDLGREILRSGNVAFMLIAHARRCQGCFGASRRNLTALGFDEPALDGFCANPAALPLPDRDRLFVQYALRIAMNAAELQPKDFRELEAHGFSREDAQEIIGLAAFSVFHTIFTTMANTALSDE